jgi:hypothetical protein
LPYAGTIERVRINVSGALIVDEEAKGGCVLAQQ